MRACVCWGYSGVCGPLIKECVGAKFAYLGSNFKGKVMEGSFLGPENVSVSPQTLTLLMIDKTARRVAAEMGFLGGIERWESNKERVLMRRCVTLETA